MFKKAVIVLLSALYFLFPVSAKQNVWNGTLHITDAGNLRRTAIRLDGYWEIYPDQLFYTLSEDEAYKHKVDFVEVPGTWKKYFSKNDQTYNAKVVSYRIVIDGLRPGVKYGFFSRRSPSTAANFFVNSELVGTFGIVDRSREEYRADQRPVYINAEADDDGKIEFVIQVADYVSLTSGIFQPIIFGEYTLITVIYYKALGWIAFILGAFLFILCVNFVMLLVSKKKGLSLYFVIALATILVYELTANMSILSWFYSNLSYSVMRKLQYLLHWLTPFTFCIIYMKEERFIERHPLVDVIWAIIFAFEGVIILCLPIRFAEVFQLIVIFTNILFSGYCVYRIIFDIRKEEKKFIPIFSFYLLFGVGSIFEFFFPNPMKHTVTDVSVFGLIVLIIFDLLYMGGIHQKLLLDYVVMNESYRKLNRIYRKFVSANFLRLTNKTGRQDIAISDYVELETAVMYIRLTTVSPDGNYVNINAEFETIHFYLGQICDIVTRNGGFIGNYLNCGCLALFNNGVNDALNAASEIRSMVYQINLRRAEDYYPCVAVSAGIHFGNVVITSIGEKNHMEMTAISECVDIADRISSIALEIGTPFLISDYAIRHVSGPISKDVNLIGDVKLRKNYTMYELYELTEENTGDLETLEAIDDLDAQLEELDKFARQVQKNAGPAKSY